MGIFFFLFLFLLLLFLLTRKLTNSLYQLFFLLTGHQKTAIILLTILLLPGTTIHELSHLCMAFILHVPAGKLTIIPKIVPPVHDSGKQSQPARGFGEAKEVHAGSIMVGKTDPFRLTLIGLAPLPLSIALLYLITNVFFASSTPRESWLPFHSSLPPSGWFRPTTNNQPLTTLIGIYLLFTISCSMFSSKKDLKALLISGPVILLVAILMYGVGIRIGIEERTLDGVRFLIDTVNRCLMSALLVDGVILLLTTLVSRMIVFVRGRLFATR